MLRPEWLPCVRVVVLIERCRIVCTKALASGERPVLNLPRERAEIDSVGHGVGAHPPCCVRLQPCIGEPDLHKICNRVQHLMSQLAVSASTRLVPVFPDLINPC